MGTPPPPANPWTDADDATLRALHSQGRTLHSIAEEMGRGKATVSLHARSLGLTWDRTRTAAAAEAKATDARARRAALQVALLEDAERLRAQLWAPALVFNFGGKDNTYESETLPQPPAADQLKIVQAVGIAIDRSLKLDLHDSAAGAVQVVGLLQLTASALGLNDAADTVPPTDPSTPSEPED